MAQTLFASDISNFLHLVLSTHTTVVHVVYSVCFASVFPLGFLFIREGTAFFSVSFTVVSPVTRTKHEAYGQLILVEWRVE